MKPFHAMREQGSGLLRKGSWGLADQMLISFTHFVTMVLLARGLGLVAFGTFSLVYGALLFLGAALLVLLRRQDAGPPGSRDAEPGRR